MRTLSIAILITFSSLVIARQPWQDATRNWETSPFLSTLPPFCSYISENIIPHPKYKNFDWKKKFGGGMTWGNHFCYALAKIPICQTYSGQNRIACLKDQTEGFTYWIGHTGPNFKLLPYIHSEYGDLLNEIGDTNKAITQYKISLKKKPNYIKGYIGLIDLYIKTGSLKEAKDTVNTALKIKKAKIFIKKQQKIDKLLSQR